MRATKAMLEDLICRLQLVRGFEGEGEEGADDSKSETDDESDDDEKEGDEEDEGDEEEDEDNDKKLTSKDVAAMKKALQTERRARRKSDRDLKKLQREKAAASKGKSDEAETARQEATEAKAKNAKLAEGYKVTRVDSVITRAAMKLKFRDTDDALKLVDRSEIEVDQDDDDPTDIVIDETTVNDALKALAKAKPHLLIAAGDQEASGGNLGSKGGNKDELDEDKLRELYPVLRR